MTHPQRKIAVLAVLILLLGLGAAYVVILVFVEPSVDVNASIEDGCVIFEIPHHGTGGLTSLHVEDSSGKPLWEVGLWSEQGHRITYGRLPNGGHMPATQTFPVTGEPRDIRGKRIIVRLAYDDSGAPISYEFRKVLDIPTGEIKENTGSGRR